MPPRPRRLRRNLDRERGASRRARLVRRRHAAPRGVGYAIVLHVHDEIVCEVPEGFGSEDEFLQIMLTLPSWAEGLPLGAKARTGPRFCKMNGTTQAAPKQPQDGISGD